ncbi:MAG: hypothetical protein KH452_02485 [Clostridiales bacterium]|nr:hypothetical protein [Clostridiales bacterium]
MDKETSREAFLRALHTETDQEDRREEELEEFVYRGKVKKDLEITGLEFIDMEEPEAEAPRPEAVVPAEEPDISVSLFQKGASLLKKAAGPVKKLLFFVFAPILKPFRKGADTITRRDWVVFFVLILAVVSVLGFTRVSIRLRNHYRTAESLYTMDMGIRNACPDGVSFSVSDDGSTVKKENGQESTVSGEPYYYEGQDRAMWPVRGVWYDSGTTCWGRIERFSSVERGEGGCLIRQKGGDSLLLKGMIYDNDDCYLFLEGTLLEYNGEKLDLPALSSVKVQMNGAVEIYPYGGDGIYAPLDTEIYASFGNGARVDIGNDILYYPNGSYRLTFLDLDYTDELSQKLLDQMEAAAEQN